MTNFTDLPSGPPDHLVPFTDQLRLAAAAYLARFKGSSRYHTESDLRCFLAWCAERDLDPLAARRPHLELYLRWMQEIRRFKPSTVSRRFSVTTGFYKTCVIDGLLDRSPAEHVRRPSVPAESPTLGFTHLLSCARDLEALPSRQRHWAECCHHVEAPCSPGPTRSPAAGVLPQKSRPCQRVSGIGRVAAST